MNWILSTNTDYVMIYLFNYLNLVKTEPINFCNKNYSKNLTSAINYGFQLKNV